MRTQPHEIIPNSSTSRRGALNYIYSTRLKICFILQSPGFSNFPLYIKVNITILSLSVLLLSRLALRNFTNKHTRHVAFLLFLVAAPNMALIFLFWFLMSAINIALIASTFYQLLCLLDLESDDINPFEASSRINFWVEPEFLLQGLFCILLLVTGHWIMFLLGVPLVCYHVNLYMKRKHLIDVTEVFRNLKVEKKVRLAKLGFYVIFFALVIAKLAMAGFEALAGKDENPLSF